MSEAPSAPALIWCPFPDTASAEAAAGALLDEGMIACVNILPAMTSLYVWQGRRERSSEAGMLLKTNSALLDVAIVRLGELHPYETPAIVGWRCDAAACATTEWLAKLNR